MSCACGTRILSRPMLGVAGLALVALGTYNRVTTGCVLGLEQGDSVAARGFRAFQVPANTEDPHAKFLMAPADDAATSGEDDQGGVCCCGVPVAQCGSPSSPCGKLHEKQAAESPVMVAPGEASPSAGDGH